MRKLSILLLAVFFGVVFCGISLAEEADVVGTEKAVVEEVAVEEVSVPKETKVLFSFEKNLQGWEIPDWCYEKDDYVAEKIVRSDKFASEGSSSLEVTVDYPGGIWTAAYTEIMQYFDWTGYSAVTVDVYIPEDAPNGLKSKMISTWGDDWKWTEMSRSTKLVPGEWVTIEADLTDESTAWRGIACDDDFRADIRKIGIRVESNMRPVYSGKIYIDNVRIIK